MNISKVLIEYDSMFGNNSLEEIERYLVTHIEQAYEEQDFYSAITLLNEYMGFCRDTSQNEKGKRCCEETVSLMKKVGLEGTVEYATSLLNVANAYRAYGMLTESLDIFKKVENCYKQSIEKNDFKFASLYNNWSLLYQEMFDFDNAKEMLVKALRIVDMYPNAVVEQATTRTNLAVTMFRISKDEKTGAHGKTRASKWADTYKQAMSYLKHALRIFESDGGRDFHYSAALAAMGDAVYMKGDYQSAAKYYSRAMAELEKHVGRTEAYNRIQEKYEDAFRRAEMNVMSVEANDMSEYDMSDEDTSYDEQEKTLRRKYYRNNLQRCRAFYKEQGAPMIHRMFEEYESRIAVGFVGEGSDCFGYDDIISMDHDYSVGFCMWLTDSDYDAISGKLQIEYEKLINLYAGYYRIKGEKQENDTEAVNRFVDGRRGVFKISEFYNKLLLANIKKGDVAYISDFTSIPEAVWYEAGDASFAACVNGEVFRDDLGEFTRIREKLLEYYPRKVWLLKLAKELHDFSQYAQSNYERSMARKDYITAMMCIAKASESAMKLAYLIDRSYAPYYKWMRKGMDSLHKLKDISVMLDDMVSHPLQVEAWEEKEYSSAEPNENDVFVLLFESMARRIRDELVAAGLITSRSTFLDEYVNELVDTAMKVTKRTDIDGTAEDIPMADSITEKLPKNVRKQSSEDSVSNSLKKEKKELVEEIVMLEWNQFDKVENEGGRADCQDDWNTFSLMRRSQYNAWSIPLLESYRNDIRQAEKDGWNLITEKYGRMMETTAPERFAEIKDSLPERDEDRIKIQEEIIKLQVEWMEEFAEKYPKMAGNARSIHTYEDSAYNTSYETYLRGEISTYSDYTLVLYGRFIVNIKNSGQNLAYIIMNNTAIAYGYKSVEDAESKL